MCNYYSDFTNKKIKHRLKDLFNVPEVVNLQNKNATAQNQNTKKKKISKAIVILKFLDMECTPIMFVELMVVFESLKTYLPRGLFSFLELSHMYPLNCIIFLWVNLGAGFISKGFTGEIVNQTRKHPRQINQSFHVRYVQRHYQHQRQEPNSQLRKLRTGKFYSDVANLNTKKEKRKKNRKKN